MIRSCIVLIALAWIPGFSLAQLEPKHIPEIRAKAEQGDTLAINKLGLAYLNGIGVPKDEAEGIRLIRLAAERGNVTAQRNLGALYYKGSYGLAKDSAESVRWYRMAADQDSRHAHYVLGMRYAAGDGVPKDEIEALARFMLAVGVEGVGGVRRKLKDSVGPDGVRAAEKRRDAIRAEIKDRKAKDKSSR